jgi:hypothetical protein
MIPEITFSYQASALFRGQQVAKYAITQRWLLLRHHMLRRSSHPLMRVISGSLNRNYVSLISTNFRASRLLRHATSIALQSARCSTTHSRASHPLRRRRATFSVSLIYLNTHTYTRERPVKTPRFRNLGMHLCRFPAPEMREKGSERWTD